MTPQSRMLIILGAFGFGGALLLMGVANRYGKLIEERAAAAPRPPGVADRQPGGRLGPAGRRRDGRAEAELADAVARVDAFVAVRRVLKEAIEQDLSPVGDQGPAESAALLDLREATARRLGLTDVDYLTVRNRVRLRANGVPAPDDALAAALELRDRQLASVDLGDDEILDP